MRSRPRPLTGAAWLLVLLSLVNLFPAGLSLSPLQPPPAAFSVYSGIVLTLLGSVAALGLWRLQRWSVWVTCAACVPSLVRAGVLALGGLVSMRMGLMSPEVEAALVAIAMVPILIMVLVMLPASQRAVQQRGDVPAALVDTR
jgi:hypothetical protein